MRVNNSFHMDVGDTNDIGQSSFALRQRLYLVKTATKLLRVHKFDV